MESNLLERNKRIAPGCACPDPFLYRKFYPGEQRGSRNKTRPREYCHDLRFETAWIERYAYYQSSAHSSFHNPFWKPCHDGLFHQRSFVQHSDHVTRFAV